MKKCGGSVKTWYWRYFDLKCQKMAYYKQKNDKFAIKSIKLIDVKTTRVSDKTFHMKTSDNDRVWEFECKSKEDAEDWVKTLNAASVRSIKKEEKK